MTNNFLIKIFFVLLSSLFLYSCAKEEIAVTGPTGNSPFIGSYEFRFTVGLSGNGTLVIDDNGNFNSTINIDNLSYRPTLKGSVLNNGIIDGKFYQDTTQVGTLHGQMYLSDNSSGICMLNGSSALWTARYIY